MPHSASGGDDGRGALDTLALAHLDGQVVRGGPHALEPARQLILCPTPHVFLLPSATDVPRRASRRARGALGDAFRTNRQAFRLLLLVEQRLGLCVDLAVKVARLRAVGADLVPSHLRETLLLAHDHLLRLTGAAALRLSLVARLPFHLLSARLLGFLLLLLLLLPLFETDRVLLFHFLDHRPARGRTRSGGSARSPLSSHRSVECVEGIRDHRLQQLENLETPLDRHCPLLLASGHLPVLNALFTALLTALVALRLHLFNRLCLIHRVRHVPDGDTSTVRASDDLGVAERAGAAR
mmetsp:Transcript_37165/g.74263  ORF Transcript_37165/g.74263 Transcript_37165/m.74263 type:complete len:296 (-) Transcript_37165:1316-2203(-)